MRGYTDRQEWMTDNQWECAQTIAEIEGGFHHMKKVKPFGFGVEVSIYGEIATFDFSKMTDMVIKSHEKLIRFSIMPSGPGMLKFVAHKRKPEGGMAQRHPSLEDLKNRIDSIMENK